MKKGTSDLEADAGARSRRSLRLASLEADLAYFQARLEILGEPKSANQWAQLKTYEVLRRSLGELILKSRRRMVKEGKDPK